MARVLIIEPHGDDALISCSSILRNAKHQKVILTLSQRESKGLKDKFPNVEEIIFKDLPDFHWDNRPVNHHQVNRWHKESKNTYDEYLKELQLNPVTRTHVDQSRVNIQWVLDTRGHFDIVIAPLGIVHPYHLAVTCAASVLQDQYPVTEFIYYSEGPYNGKKYGLLLEDDAILRDEMLLRVPHDEDWVGEKKKIYSELYPTETNLFRFSHDEVLRNDERYLVPKVNVKFFKEFLEVE